MALEGKLFEMELDTESERIARMRALEGEEEAVDVAIVGGGLGGLALLLALHTRGIQAHLYEKYPGLRSDTATAIGIGPNGVTALEGISQGLSKIICDLGTSTKLTTSAVNGVSSSSTKWPDATYITVNWKLVQQALAKLVCKDYIHCSHELLSYKQVEDGHVNAYFEVKDETNSNSSGHLKTVRTRLLIGADGIWSAVRKQMINDEPRYLHMVDWNAIVHDPHQKLLQGVGRGEIYVHTDVKWSSLFFLVNAGDYSMWILRKTDESGELGASLLRKQGSFGDPRSKARALQQIEGSAGCWDTLRKAIEATDERFIFERKIMDCLPLDKWSDADGHVLLIGDAAHAQYVGPGQGARTAFEDAHQLAMLLEEAKYIGFSKDSIHNAVNKFEEVRIPRMRKIQEYAAHSTGQARFQPEWVQKLTREEVQKRGFEFRKWVHEYPKNQQGDPESTYFK